MSTSRMSDVTAALIALWSAQSSLLGVTIYDGPPVSSAPDADLITVGDDADPSSDAASAFEQEWANLSHSRRSERGEIVCATVAQNGSTALVSTRARAFELLAACEAALLADPTLGDLAFTTELISGSSKPIQNNRGTAVVVPFTVRYWTQL